MRLIFKTSQKRLQNYNSENIYNDLIASGAILPTDKVHIRYDGIKGEGFMEFTGFPTVKTNKIKADLRSMNKLRDVE